MIVPVVYDDSSEARYRASAAISSGAPKRPIGWRSVKALRTASVSRPCALAWAARRSSSDGDYYRLTVGAGKTLTSTLTPNASSDYDLYLYNSSGSQLASSINGTGQVDQRVRTTPSASSVTWYVRVRYYSGNTGASGTYTLGLSQ